MSASTFTPEALNHLEVALAERQGSCEAVELATLIRDMKNARPGELPHQRFSRLCELALLAFNDKQVDDGAIRANPVTPILVRYLLLALVTYAKKAASGQTGDTRARADAITSGLMMVNEVKEGARTLKWTEQHQQRYYLAFVGEHHQAVEEGAAPHVAYRRGLKAAYDAYRGPSAGPQDPKDAAAVRRDLRELFKSHGHPEPRQNSHPARDRTPS